MFAAFVYIAILVAAMITVTIALVAQSARGSTVPTAADIVTDPAAAAAARRHAGRVAAVAGALGFTLLLVGPSQATTSFDGLVAGIATGLVPATAGLAFIAAHAVGEATWPEAHGRSRTASLVPRTVADVAPRRLRRWLWTALVLGTLTVVVGSLTAASDGRSLSFDDPILGIAGTSGPYPGWFYGLPLLAGCVAIVGGVELLLAWIARRPTIAGVDVAFDTRMRRLSAHRVLRGAQLVVALTVAGMLIVGGEAALSLDRNNVLNGGAHLPHGAWGIVALALGFVLAVTGIVIAAIPYSERRPVEARSPGLVGMPNPGPAA